MSTIKRVKTSECKEIHFERFDSAAEVVETCRHRKITDSSFENMQRKSLRKNWHGVNNYEEALELMKTGYQPAVESLKGVFKADVKGSAGRYSFTNSIQGFAPIVPLALKGVPNSMLNMQMKTIKAKVIDVYYDMTSSSGTSPEQIMDAGNKLLGTIIELERQGYRFNLYAVQAYHDSSDTDMLVVKVKNANQPLDIRRVSFPLIHTAFFRVIGFDWYSKMPGGKYRCAYGHALGYDYSEETLTKMAKELFGNNSVYFSATKIIGEDKDHIREVLKNGNSKN